MRVYVSACTSPYRQYIGNGWCVDENNNAGCGYDGGDCCGPNVRTQYCIECQCLEENMISKASPGPFCACSIDHVKPSFFGHFKGADKTFFKAL